MIPPFKDFMLPILRYLQDEYLHDRVEIRLALAKEFCISEDDLMKRSLSGKIIMKGNVDWAVSSLKAAGLVVQPEVGKLMITNDGLELLKDPPQSIDNAFLASHYPSFKAFKKRRNRKDRKDKKDNAKMEINKNTNSCGKQILSIEEALSVIQICKKGNIPIPPEIVKIVEQENELKLSKKLNSGLEALHKSLLPLANSVTILVEFNSNDWRGKIVSDLFAYESQEGNEFKPEETFQKGKNIEGKNSKPKKSVKKSTRRPPLNFYEMGLVDGDILVYKEDPNVKVEIRDSNKVLFNGEQLSLTKLTMQLKGLSQAIQPTPHWLFEGRNLADIYDEIYPKEK